MQKEYVAPPSRIWSLDNSPPPHISNATLSETCQLTFCPLRSQGLLKPICEVWPVAQFPEAVKKLKSGKVAGRCVINYNA